MLNFVCHTKQKHQLLRYAAGTHRPPVHGNSTHVICAKDQAHVIAKYIHWKATSFHGRFNWSYVGEGKECWYLSLQTCRMDG
jgi:uncharacterized protein (DUF2249 family)